MMYREIVAVQWKFIRNKLTILCGKGGEVTYVIGSDAHCNQWALNIHNNMTRKREKRTNVYKLVLNSKS
jgi:hypothetical protein